MRRPQLNECPLRWLKTVASSRCRVADSNHIPLIHLLVYWICEAIERALGIGGTVHEHVPIPCMTCKIRRERRDWKPACAKMR